MNAEDITRLRTDITAEHFKYMRIKLHMNQAEFGELFGFQAPQKRVSEIETGQVNISSQVAVICVLLAENALLEKKLKKYQRKLA